MTLFETVLAEIIPDPKEREELQEFYGSNLIRRGQSGPSPDLRQGVNLGKMEKIC